MQGYTTNFKKIKKDADEVVLEDLDCSKCKCFDKDFGKMPRKRIPTEVFMCTLGQFSMTNNRIDLPTKCSNCRK